MASRCAIVLVALPLALAGCASLDADSATAAARRFVSAAAENRADDACAVVAPRAATDCAEAVADLGDLGEVRSAQLWGGEARVETGNAVMFLHEFAAGWLVTGAGCVGDGESPYECAVGGP
ncbi:hypothetical protein ACFPM7_16715 [Actinokineospora guangxiensis]|uniref:Lipoprotein n=1 Tax=Actinokineospora guangxiensis TaxID=1490288 RepID=A0ABW0EPK7_9PSEU